MKTNLALAILGASILAGLTTGCTKSRNPEIKDQVLREEIFEIAALNNKEFAMKTGSAGDDSPGSLKLKAVQEKPAVQIESSTVPEGLAKMFRGLTLRANAEQNFQIRLKVDKESLHVLKVATDPSQLSLVERQSLMTEKDKSSLVPLFKLKVSDYGRLCQIKDDNGDKTSKMDLCPTDFESATHVRLAVNRNERATYLTAEQTQELFLAEKINGKVTTLAQLKTELNLSLHPVDDSQVVSYVTPASGSKVQLLIYQISKKSEVRDQKLLSQLKSDIRLGAITHCPKDVLAQLQDKDKKDCVMVLSHTVDGNAVEAHLKSKNDLGESTLAIEFKAAEASKGSLIQFAAKTPVQVQNPSELSKLNPYNTIRVVDVKDKEFLLRRTFEDGASSIQMFGPGASGRLDIVRFELVDDRLIVRRATTLNGEKSPSRIDLEELMSFAVQYLAIDPQSSSIQPKLIPAKKELAQYLVLDWTKNSIPATNSPLSFIDSGECFQSVAAQEITDLDNRIHDGYLNFTIEGSYNFRPDCISWYNPEGYGFSGKIQSNFNIKERVSFKLHNGELDKKALDLPFRAQKLLGFGLFTMGDIKPDNFGNHGLIGTEVARPVIHDFSNGKQLIYHLGGLPESGWMRDALIEGTQQVIKEWNESLETAFTGTSLSRAKLSDEQKQFIVLKIDGADNVKPGRLGDLDRNYIWNFEKNLDSGLLGMSQAGANPRSGRIEQNNILMYSGNLLSQIGTYREMARIQKEFLVAREKAMKSAGIAAGSSASTGNSDAAEGLMESLNNRSSISFRQTPDLKAFEAGELILSQLKASSPRSEKFQRDQKEISERKTKALAAQTHQFAYLDRIVRKAIEMKITQDESGLAALSSAEILKAYGKDLSIEQREALTAQTRRLAMMAEFRKNFTNGQPNCAFSAQPIANLALANPDLLSDEKLPATFKSWYMSTLAHEMGHSLGLTHNFKGSFDKGNFAFQTEAKTDRNYSSIMDYIPDSYMKYAGPGPYDVRALRVAYTGFIELKDEPTATRLKGLMPVYKLAPGVLNPEVTLTDFKKFVLGDRSWMSLDSTYKNKISLKDYQFCTDIHVGDEPTCNRWDLGTTPLEIVQYYADEYKSMYPVLNGRGNKIKTRGRDAYVSRIMMNYFAMRGFLEEFFWKDLTNQDARAELEATQLARDTFLEILSTPTAHLSIDSPNRFQKVKVPLLGADGRPIAGKTEDMVIELKAASDIQVAGLPDQVQTRGIEVDKALALMMLTTRGESNQRRSAVSLYYSFADFDLELERNPQYQALKKTAFPPMPTINALQSLMMNRTPGMISTNNGLRLLPAAYKYESTAMIRYYGALAAGVYLDADTIRSQDNFSAYFRVASSQSSVPQDRLATTLLDQDVKSPGSLKYWSLDNARFANQLVIQASVNRLFIENQEPLVKALIEAGKAQQQNDDKELAAARTKIVEILKKMNSTMVFVSADQVKKGIFEQMAQNAVNFIKIHSEFAVETAQQVRTMLLGQNLSQGQLSEILRFSLQKYANEVETMGQADPMIALAQKAMFYLHSDQSGEESPGKDRLAGQVVHFYMDPGILEKGFSVTVGNLQFLNQILVALHPELNRY